MSQEYILECAKNFQNLFQKTQEKIKTVQGKDEAKGDFLTIKNGLGELENLLNTIELESSLLGRNSESYEFNIAQTCRSNFNQIRKDFQRIENGALKRLLPQK